jgi:hypothetical protein
MSSLIGSSSSKLAFDLLLASLGQALYLFFKGVLLCFGLFFPQQIVADLPQENHPLFNYFRDITDLGGDPVPVIH